jgi:hypothetical protein
MIQIETGKRYKFRLLYDINNDGYVSGFYLYQKVNNRNVHLYFRHSVNHQIMSVIKHYEMAGFGHRNEYPEYAIGTIESIRDYADYYMIILTNDLKLI